MCDTILLVEADVLAAWNEILSLENAGHRVVHARNRIQALEYILERPDRFDLILADPWAMRGWSSPTSLARDGEGEDQIDLAGASLIAVRDLNGDVSISNDRYASFDAGLEPRGEGRVEGDRALRLEIAELMRARDRAMVDEGRTVELEDLVDLRSGEWRSFLTTRIPLRSKLGLRPYGLVAVSLDLAGAGRGRAGPRDSAACRALLGEEPERPILVPETAWPTLDFALM